MSSGFIDILLLPLIPLAIGLVPIIHLTMVRRIPLEMVVRPFIKKVLGWGFIAAAAFAVFVILGTAVTGSPQGPLMLLFVSVPFALGEFVGLVAWAWRAYAT